MRSNAEMTVEHDACHCHIVHKRPRNATTEAAFRHWYPETWRLRRPGRRCPDRRIMREAIRLWENVLQLNCTRLCQESDDNVKGSRSRANHSFLKFWKVSRS